MLSGFACVGAETNSMQSRKLVSYSSRPIQFLFVITPMQAVSAKWNHTLQGDSSPTVFNRWIYRIPLKACNRNFLPSAYLKADIAYDRICSTLPTDEMPAGSLAVSSPARRKIKGLNRVLADGSRRSSLSSCFQRPCIYCVDTGNVLPYILSVSLFPFAATCLRM